MGGSDFYCSVTGMGHLYGPDQVQTSILETIEDGDFSDCELEEEIIMNGADRIAPDVIKGLLLDEEDVAASNDFVMFCPYTKTESGAVVLHAEFDDPRPDEPSEENITEVFDVVPGHDADLGGFESKDGVRKYHVHNYGPTCVVMYTGYLILRQAAPAVKPHTIYALFAAVEGSQGNLDGIDYSPLNELCEQYVCWSYTCDLPPGDDYRKTATIWLNLLTQKDMSVQEILQMAWERPGNLWALVRPDKFPIAHTLKLPPLPAFPANTDIKESLGPPNIKALPPDVLMHIIEFLPVRSIFAMLGVCRLFRSAMLPHANPVSYRRILADEPWLLPAGPFELGNSGRGREEIDFWEVEWAKGGLEGGPAELASRIPWLQYRRACTSSYSMWNRKRIWGIAKQIEKRASDKGLI